MGWTVFGWQPKTRPLLRQVTLAALALSISACASKPPDVPYPAFIQADTLPDIFVAGLPGIRGKRFAGSAETRRSSNLLSIPPNWDFSTGGMPEKSVEIYVVAGNLSVGEFDLAPGGYAYVPDGRSGIPLRTEGGARILYFLDDAHPDALIQTPLITNQQYIPWSPLSADAADAGISVKELRADPGSGARTYLLNIAPGARRAWQSVSVVEEGFMLEGNYTHSECVDGQPVTASYLPGGYYHRPAAAVNGGPQSAATVNSVWLVRVLTHAETTKLLACGDSPD